MLAPPSAGLNLNCPTFFARLAKMARTPVFDEKAVARIEGYFNDLALNPNQAAGKAFDEYVNLRVTNLPSDMQARLRQVLENIQSVRQKELNGSHKASTPGGLPAIGSSVIKVEGPLRYRQGIVDYSTRVHEFEHAIQHELQAAQRIPSTYSSFHIFGGLVGFKSSTHGKFFAELGAMRAEWEFLRAIPLKQRRELALAMSKDLKLYSSDRVHWQRVLNNADLSQDEFIAAEHAAGHYSKKDVASSGTWYTIGIPAKYSVPVVGLGGAYFGLNQLRDGCLIMALRGELPSQNQLVKEFCNSLPGVQTILKDPPTSSEQAEAEVQVILDAPWWR